MNVFYITSATIILALIILLTKKARTYCVDIFTRINMTVLALLNKTEYIQREKWLLFYHYKEIRMDGSSGFFLALYFGSKLLQDFRELYCALEYNTDFQNYNFILKSSFKTSCIPKCFTSQLFITTIHLHNSVLADV